MQKCRVTSDADMHSLRHMSTPWTIRYVRHVMKETGLAPSALAVSSGMSSTTLTRPLNNPDHPFDLSMQTILKIQDKTGISFAPFAPEGQLSQVQTKPDPDQSLPAGQGVMVDVYSVTASAGGGSFVDEESIIERLAFPSAYLNRITKSHPRHLAIIGVKGDSMERTLSDDDVVMIDTSKHDLSFDGLFVIRDDGASLLVKRIGRGSRKGFVTVISDNSAYGSTERPREDIEVVGKVIWIGKKV